jgi:hypothetical protein
VENEAEERREVMADEHENEIDQHLKETLHGLIRGPGGFAGVLYTLRDIANELADAQSSILENESRAERWKITAKALDLAAMRCPIHEVL